MSSKANKSSPKKATICPEKKEAILLMIKRKKECMQEAQKIVHQLIEPNVCKDFLLENVSPIQFCSIFVAFHDQSSTS